MNKDTGNTVRDSRGRFRKKITYVVIDEFGNVIPYSKKEKTFGYSATITDDIEKMNQLSKDNRKRHGTENEVKASTDTTWNKLLMSLNIRKAGLTSKAYYVDKRRPPHGWNDGSVENYRKNKKRAETRMGILDYALEDSMKDVHGNVYVIVDGHTALSNTRNLCVNKSNNKRTVDGSEFSSSNGKYADALQTNDYVTNATGSATKGFPLRSKIIGTKIHRIRKYESVRYVKERFKNKG